MPKVNAPATQLKVKDIAPAALAAATAAKPAPTAEQLEIIAAARRGLPVQVIEAGAGTGKTTTLRLIADAIEADGQYTAFNASLVAESKEKFAGTRVACNTTHSLGFRAVGKQFQHRLNGPRVRAERIAQLLGIQAFTVQTGESQSKRLAAGFLAAQVMGAVKKFCQSADTEISGKHFRYIDGIDTPIDGKRCYENNEKIREYLQPFAEAYWDDICDTEGQLPFNHDHYVKIWQLSDAPVIPGKYILLDEAQDTAPVMLDILKRQSVPVILVGDSAQQIYEWRGAVNALGSFGADAPRNYLSQSFRFGEAVAAVANAVLDTLQEPTALRLKGFAAIPSRLEVLPEPRAFLCRTNALAVSTLIGTIAKGRKGFLVGGGADVTAFVKAAQELQRGQATSHPELACFNSWGEVQEYVKEDEGEDLKLMVKLIDEFTAEAILEALAKMPAYERDADLVISTAHKSKGREWPTVKLGSDFPSCGDMQDADAKLLYVAVTRAQEVLDISSCPPFCGPEEETGEPQPFIAVRGVPQGTPEELAAYRAKKADKATQQPAAVAPQAAPAAAPSGAPGGSFTWSKGRDGSWLVRGPKGCKGQTVNVRRQNGTGQEKTLLAVIWENEEVALYKV